MRYSVPSSFNKPVFEFYKIYATNSSLPFIFRCKLKIKKKQFLKNDLKKKFLLSIFHSLLVANLIHIRPHPLPSHSAVVQNDISALYVSKQHGHILLKEYNFK